MDCKSNGYVIELQTFSFDWWIGKCTGLLRFIQMLQNDSFTGRALHQIMAQKHNTKVTQSDFFLTGSKHNLQNLGRNILKRWSNHTIVSNSLEMWSWLRICPKEERTDSSQCLTGGQGKIGNNVNIGADRHGLGRGSYESNWQTGEWWNPKHMRKELWGEKTT